MSRKKLAKGTLLHSKDDRMLFTVLPPAAFHPPISRIFETLVNIPKSQTSITILLYKGKQPSDGRYSVLYLTKEGKLLIPKLRETENHFDEELSREKEQIYNPSPSKRQVQYSPPSKHLQAGSHVKMILLFLPWQALTR